MKRKVYVILLTLGMSSIVYGGGNYKPVPYIAVADDNSFYLGVGASRMILHNNVTKEVFNSGAMMLQAGYQFNPYVALEARYTHSLGYIAYNHGKTKNSNNNKYSATFTNKGIYLKLMHQIGEFTPYILLGYGEVSFSKMPRGGAGVSATRTERGFQWGVGASYKLTRKVSIFADYVNAYHGNGFDGRAKKVKVNSSMWTIGFTYRF